MQTFVKNRSRERATRVFSSRAQQKAPAWGNGFEQEKADAERTRHISYKRQQAILELYPTLSRVLEAKIVP